MPPTVAGMARSYEKTAVPAELPVGGGHAPDRRGHGPLLRTNCSARAAPVGGGHAPDCRGHGPLLQSQNSSVSKSCSGARAATMAGGERRGRKEPEASSVPVRKNETFTFMASA